MASATAAAGPALALEHAEDRAAEQHGVARRGRELRPAALAQPAHDRRSQVGGLTGQPHGASLAQPGPAHVAPERGGRERRRQVGIVRADHQVGVLVERRQEQGLARARDLRGAPLERGGREHVDVRLGEPAREVAAAGGRGDAARERKPGMRERRARPRAGEAPRRCRRARARTAPPPPPGTPRATRARRRPRPAATSRGEPRTSANATPPRARARLIEGSDPLTLGGQTLEGWTSRSRPYPDGCLA